MTRRPAPARSQTQNLKLLISTAAVAATIGGWSALSAAQSSVETAALTTVSAEIPAWLREAPPIPTVAAVGALHTVPQPALVVRAPILARPAPITTTRSSR